VPDAPTMIIFIFVNFKIYTHKIKCDSRGMIGQCWSCAGFI
jgi:hypothetical protein